MRILGIVAEYDPFHNGHAFHLGRARSLVQPDSTVVALSACMKQQGDFPLLPPSLRAQCAVRSGADAVFALPVLWTVRDAEHYALGAVALLAGLGITHLSFGAEDPDLSALSRLANLLEDSPDALRSALRIRLEKGLGYPAALSNAVCSLLPEDGPLLCLPNNLLAVCYLRAIRRLSAEIVPIPVPRVSSHHGLEIRPESPSASALRSAVRRGWYREAYAAVPPCTRDALRGLLLSGSLPDPSVADVLVLSAVRSLDKEKARLLPGLSEGLEDGLLSAASEASGLEDLVARLTSRRYPAARIRRLCAYAMLGVTAGDLESLPLPSSAHLLALRKKPEMTARWKDRPVRILSTAEQWRASTDYRADRIAWRLYAQACHLPDTLPYTERIFSCQP